MASARARPCGMAGLRPLVERFRLVRFDMRGHGDSPLPTRFKWTLDGAIADVNSVADAVCARRFHIVGESTGGTVALAMAARHPERVLSVTVLNGAHRAAPSRTSNRGSESSTTKGWPHGRRT